MAAVTVVSVEACDPVIRSGIEAQLAHRPELCLAAVDAAPDVVVLAVDAVDEAVLAEVRHRRRAGGTGVLVVSNEPDERTVWATVEAGACGLLRRSEATGDALAAAVRGAGRGDGTLPPDLLGRLLADVGHLQRQVLAPNGWSPTGLNDRETAVLRLAADGLGTGQIAEQLHYSERTIKNVIHDVTTRLGLANRTHAVAYAMREGLI